MTKSEFVNVEVRKAIAFGGTVIRPTMDGKEIVPAKAVIPRDEAERQGPRRVKIVGPAPDPKAKDKPKQKTSPADKQVTGAADKD